MGLKRDIYAVFLVLIIVGISFLAMENLQDVDVTVPYIGFFHTKLFIVMISSFILGFLTSEVFSLLIRLFSIPSNLREKHENRSIPKTVEDSQEKKQG